MKACIGMDAQRGDPNKSYVDVLAALPGALVPPARMEDATDASARAGCTVTSYACDRLPANA